MIRKAVLLFAFVFAAFNAFGQHSKSDIAKNIPSLESVSGIWINADTLGYRAVHPQLSRAGFSWVRICRPFAGSHPRHTVGAITAG